MIDRVTIDKILDAAQIVDVVSDFVTLKRAGANYKGLCPFHDDRTPSFMVSPAKNYCKCFACGKGGNPVGFIMEHEQLTYPDALRWLARKYGITIEEKEMTAEEKANQTERDSLFIVNDWANKWFQEQLRNTPDGRAIGLSYFRGRGFRDDIIEKFQLGYSPSQREACTQAALKAGYQEKFLESSLDNNGIAHGVGISIRRDNGTLFDRFAGRVMFPIFTIGGKVVGFGGRVLDKATKGVSVKYQNSPESIIYHKKNELYGLFQAKQAINKLDCVYMVEGYTDVISMHQAGVENVVASSGTALTNEQIRLVQRFTNNIVVLYDGDAAGIKASQRGIDMLLRAGMNVRLLLLPEGKDPDDFARENSPQQLQQYMQEHQVDFIRFKTDLLMQEAKGDPIRMSNLINNIVQSIAVIQDEIKRSLYIRETAQMMHLDERLITDSVAKQIKKNIEEWRKEKERESRTNTRIKSQTSGAPATNVNSSINNAAGFPPSNLPPAGFPTNDVPPTDFPPVDMPPAGFPPADVQAGFPPVDVPPAGFSPNGIPPAGIPPVDMPPAGFPPADVTNGGIPVDNAGGDSFLSPLNPRQPEGELDTASSKIEKLIIQAIIRFGEVQICNCEDENGQDRLLTVIEYVYYSLQQDNLTFGNSFYQSLLEMAMEHVGDEGFKSERFFLNHQDQQISAFAFELSTDREELSNFYKRGGSQESEQQRYNMLMDLTNHLLADLKLEIIQRQKQEIMQQMKDPAVLSDREKRTDLMQRFNQVKKLEAVLAKACGDRVMTR